MKATETIIQMIARHIPIVIFTDPAPVPSRRKKWWKIF